jgi:hypothetical protein
LVTNAGVIASHFGNKIGDTLPSRQNEVLIKVFFARLDSPIGNIVCELEFVIARRWGPQSFTESFVIFPKRAVIAS